MPEIKIDDIRRQLEDISLKSRINSPEEKPGQSFSSVLQKAINDVNTDQLKGEESIQNYISGKETSLHNTLISLEKAEISFKLMMQVRGKLMEAYQTIMRTSV
jgi:flagellar hook-basal body complex protein FliE